MPFVRPLYEPCMSLVSSLYEPCMILAGDIARYAAGMQTAFCRQGVAMSGTAPKGLAQDLHAIQKTSSINQTIVIMKTTLQRLSDKATATVRNWWLILIGGIACIAAGISAFCFPAEFYLTLSVLLGIVMLVSGIVEIALFFGSRSYFVRSGFNLLGGILDLVLGIILCAHVGISAIILPIMLGVWLLFRSIQFIDFWSRMRMFDVPNSTWQIVVGVLLLLLSVCILFNPFRLGASMVIVLAGCGLLLAGLTACITAFHLRKIHTFVKKNIIEDATFEEI